MKMKSTFIATISKVHEPVFSGEVNALTLPGEDGEFTVLPHHEPLITLLKKGIITVHAHDGAVSTFNVEHGVFETSNNHATVLI